MKIEIGKFYANDYFDNKETNVILVLADKGNTPDFQIRTETMYLVNGEVNSIFENNWMPQYLKREATDEEIQLFKQKRNQLGKLQTYSEIMLTIE